MLPGHRYHTVLQIYFGLFEFIAVHIGLYNAPATLQRLMNVVLNEAWNKICTLYLDVILVFLTTPIGYLQ